MRTEHSERERIKEEERMERKARKREEKLAHKKARKEEIGSLPKPGGFRILAFCALLVYAIALIFHAVVGNLTALANNRVCNLIVNILQLVSELLILFTIAIPSYKLIHKRSKFWMIVYVIALVLFILGSCGVAISGVMQFFKG